MSDADGWRPATSRILAIGTIVSNVDLATTQTIFPEEVKETIALYLDGKIDQGFSCPSSDFLRQRAA
jgi:hypothetical protein